MIGTPGYELKIEGATPSKNFPYSDGTPIIGKFWLKFWSKRPVI
jgi:hypothetical protein